MAPALPNGTKDTILVRFNTHVHISVVTLYLEVIIEVHLHTAELVNDQLQQYYYHSKADCEATKTWDEDDRIDEDESNLLWKLDLQWLICM